MISTRERAWVVVVAKITVVVAMTSVPVSTRSVKVLDVVAVPSRDSVTFGVLVPTPRVTILKPGDTGESVAPVDQLPVVS